MSLNSTPATPGEAARRETFERDKVCYEQNFQQFRAMNQTMWQVPLLGMSITGGLWYATFSIAGAQTMRAPLLVLSAVFDIALVLVLYRVRHVMGAYLTKLKDFNPNAYVEAPGTNRFNSHQTVMRAFSFALGIASIFSLAGAVYIGWLHLCP